MWCCSGCWLGAAKVKRIHPAPMGHPSKGGEEIFRTNAVRHFNADSTVVPADQSPRGAVESSGASSEQSSEESSEENKHYIGAIKWVEK
jgi:hypothetical protein